MFTRYAPQLLWVLVGPVIGAFSGAVMGTLVIWSMVLSDPDSWAGVGIGLLSGLYLGGLYGGICGVAVGFVTGVPFAFLVGRHLPRAAARRRARVLGAVVPPVAMVGLGASLLDMRLSWQDGYGNVGVLLVLAGAAFLGSRLAGWIAGLDAPPRPADTDACTDACCAPKDPGAHHGPGPAEADRQVS